VELQQTVDVEGVRFWPVHVDVATRVVRMETTGLLLDAELADDVRQRALQIAQCEQALCRVENDLATAVTIQTTAPSLEPVHASGITIHSLEDDSKEEAAAAATGTESMHNVNKLSRTTPLLSLTSGFFFLLATL
jgi:hypothetical protein